MIRRIRRNIFVRGSGSRIHRHVLTTTGRLFIRRKCGGAAVHRVIRGSNILAKDVCCFFGGGRSVFRSLIVRLLQRYASLVTTRFERRSPTFHCTTLYLIRFRTITVGRLIHRACCRNCAAPLAFRGVASRLTSVANHVFNSSLKLSGRSVFLHSLLVGKTVHDCVIRFSFDRSVSDRGCTTLILSATLRLLNVSTTRDRSILTRLRRHLPRVRTVTSRVVRQQ